MGFWEDRERHLSEAWNWLSGNKDKQDKKNFNQQQLGITSPLVTQNQGLAFRQQDPNVQNLIGMTNATAQGQGPSQAGMAYNQASQNAMSQAAALGHGNSQGAARQASQNIGQIQQGQAQGYAQARNQEMMDARKQYAGAVGLDQERQQANQNAWMQLLAQQLGIGKEFAQGGPTNGQTAGSLLQGLGAMFGNSK